MYLCLECHNSIHGKEKSIDDSYIFTPDGQLIPKAPLKKHFDTLDEDRGAGFEKQMSHPIGGVVKNY